MTKAVWIDDVMTFAEYERLAHRSTPPNMDQKEMILLAALGVAGESGEFVELVKKYMFHGHQLDRKKAIKELGDILWYVAHGARALGATLQQVAEANIEKLAARYPDGFMEKDSHHDGD
jgi:NTP pyrophosphatase (non-canonical NTP hydrolase)